MRRYFLAMCITLLLAGSAWGQDHTLEPPFVQLPPPIPTPPLPPNPPLYLWPPIERVEIKPYVPMVWVWEIAIVPLDEVNAKLRSDPRWEPTGTVIEKETLLTRGPIIKHIIQYMILRRQVPVKEGEK